jgi:uncharacterized YccA/Bax inhibitor family protein
MQSSNPVFNRSEGFNGRGSQHAYGATTHSGNQVGYPQYGGPTDTWQGGPQGYVDQGRMTIDTVVQKTAITMGVVVVSAAVTWLLTGDIRATGSEGQAALALTYTLAMGGALIGFALAMVNSFKRIVSPPLVLAYAVVQGVFVGAFSKVIVAQFGGDDGMSLVVGAVIGTFGAVGGTLAAYKFFDIQVTDRFRKWVVAAIFGFVAISLLNFVLSFFSADFGFNGYGTMGLLSSVVGLALGVLMLILDFDFVERGIAAGLPERESWRAAFGLAVTIIWIYIELLRILAILRGSD